MPMQVDLLAMVGVPVNHAELMLRPRIDRVERSIHSDNTYRAPRAAELLGIPAAVCHTVTDNLAWDFVEKLIQKHTFHELGEIVEALLEIPEYKVYAKLGSAPLIVSGSKRGRPGKIFATEFTGGTNGPEEFFEAQSRAGVGTILSMHVPEKSLEEARKHRINIIQCNHMASDSLGVNLLLDSAKKIDPKMSVIEMSGFVRVERKK
jgi:putative NIF3 family GTP cyclohydrolase 1 type 2